MNSQELKTIRAFQGLDDGALANLARVLTERTWTDGELVFAEGEPGDCMYFIAEGAVRLEKRADAGSGTVRKTIGILTAGDFFGVMALLDSQARPTTAIILGTTRAFILTRPAFAALLAASTQVSVGVLLSMLQTTGERVSVLCAQRLAYDEVGKAIGESRSLEQLLDKIGRQLCQATLADWGLVALRAQFSDRVEVRATVNLQLTAAQKEELAADGGILALAFRESQERLVPNLNEDESLKAWTGLKAETSALLLAPIQIEKQALGLIVLGGNQPGQFDLNDLNLACGIAGQTAQAIVNARHREEESARARHTRQFVRF